MTASVLVHDDIFDAISRRTPRVAFGTVVMMTLLLVLLYSSPSWYTRVPASVLAIAALIYTPLRTSPALWFTVTVVIAAGIGRDWFILDNHKYLLCYWCLAVTCAVSCTDREAALAKAARWLIGGSFLIAVLWKLRSADFLDGSFFQYSLLFDTRFAFFATTFGGASNAVMELNASARQALVGFDSTLTEVSIVVPSGVVWLAGMMTVWTLLIEAAVALAFILPARSMLGRRRDALLLTFIGTTYLMAPVIGFGWVLGVMGLAQCEPVRRRWRAAYVVMFVALVLYRIPWKSIVANMAL